MFCDLLLYLLFTSPAIRRAKARIVDSAYLASALVRDCIECKLNAVFFRFLLLCRDLDLVPLFCCCSSLFPLSTKATPEVALFSRRWTDAVVGIPGFLPLLGLGFSRWIWYSCFWVIVIVSVQTQNKNFSRPRLYHEKNPSFPLSLQKLGGYACGSHKTWSQNA